MSSVGHERSCDSYWSVVVEMPEVAIERHDSDTSGIPPTALAVSFKDLPDHLENAVNGAAVKADQNCGDATCHSGDGHSGYGSSHEDLVKMVHALRRCLNEGISCICEGQRRLEERFDRFGHRFQVDAAASSTPLSTNGLVSFQQRFLGDSTGGSPTSTTRRPMIGSTISRRMFRLGASSQDVKEGQSEVTPSFFSSHPGPGRSTSMNFNSSPEQGLGEGAFPQRESRRSTKSSPAGACSNELEEPRSAPAAIPSARTDLGQSQTTKSAQTLQQRITRGESEMSVLGAAQGRMHKHIRELVRPNERRLSWLDMMSATLIILYTITIGLQIEVSMQSRSDPDETWTNWFFWVDLVFVGGFVAELSVRIYVQGWRFITGREYRWNIFDCLIIAGALVDLVFKFLNVSFLRSIRVLRAARTLRIVRTTRFVRELRLMVASILSSLYSLLWAFVLILFMIYIFSVCIMQMVHAYTEDRSDLDLDPELLEYYGSLPRAMNTLFEAISGGTDWSELIRPLHNVSGLSAAFFMFYIIFVLFGVMNILTAIFVESASRIAEVDRDLVIQANRDTEYRTARAIKMLLYNRDSAGSGTITKDALEAHLAEPQTIGYLKVLGLDVSEARELFQLLDIEDDKAVDIEEFIGGVMRLKGSAKGVDVATVMYENKRILAKLVSLSKTTEERFATLMEALGVVDTVPRSFPSGEHAIPTHNRSLRI